ncbi:T9SS type A sorting domain-containing protein [Gynurincola endophyticus]|uniref:T9SS type A sorting domain-containing protein n=1 Tax=Gynurincola endophyticus TaxID=2479004 RepID=UPI000F8F2F3C|nr:T9SS type A sorting domain-containing protein [Gynurincola endophyticus]
MKSVIILLRTVVLLAIIQVVLAHNLMSQSLLFEVNVANVSVPSSDEASQGDVLRYTVTLTNQGTSNIQNATLVGFIPAGTSYLPGSTRLNGNVVVDISGNHPFAGAGRSVQPNGFASGLIPAGFSITMEYQVRVTANAGNINNHAYIEGMYNGSSFNENTSTIYTTILPDANCATIYQSVGSTSNSGSWGQIRILNTLNGTAGTRINPGTAVYNALSTNTRINNYTGLSNTAALAIDRVKQRLYFVNNSNDADLCYIDLQATTPRQYCFRNTPLNPGININKMTFSSDGWGYALTTDNERLIRFRQDPVTDALTIDNLGSLINDPINPDYVDIMNEVGGDIFGDGSGNLYLIANSNSLYRINTATRLSTFLGTVTPSPTGISQSIAIDDQGTVYIGGRYNNIMKVNLATMEATNISPIASNPNIFHSGDFASCNFPVITPVISANKKWRNLSGDWVPKGGDTIEYTIEVINTGNINAAGVKVYDSVPSLTHYVAGSTRLNGIIVADVSGSMPFSVNGGMMINSPGQAPGIIRPTSTYKAVLSFRVVVQPLQIICNQSRVFLLDVNNDIIHVNSHSGEGDGNQNSTCFFTDGVLSDLNIDFQHSFAQQKHLLKWKVSAPEAVTSYELELSRNGYEFYPVHQQNAGENITNYQYYDATSIAGNTRYYRLKLIKQNGEIQYSVIIRVQNQVEENFKIINNPVQNQLNYQYTATQPGVYQLRVIDLTGNILQQERVVFSSGLQQKALYLAATIRSGMYVLEISNGNGVYQTRKFIKQ